MLGRPSNGWRNPRLPQSLKTAAWLMRKAPTPAEKILWEHLRNRRLDGFRFRRQHIVGSCIADFYCHEASLAVEVDGAIHILQKAGDDARNAAMRELGITVVRLSNECVLQDIEEAKRRIRAHLTPPLPPKPHSRPP